MWHKINKALEVAQNSDYCKHKVGAVILDKRGRIISTGFNKQKTHPLQAKYAPPEKQFLHAEIAALVAARKDGHTIVVARRRKDGHVGLAKPCPICAMAIADAGIKEVVYTVDDDTYSVMRL